MATLVSTKHDPELPTMHEDAVLGAVDTLEGEQMDSFPTAIGAPVFDLSIVEQQQHIPQPTGNFMSSDPEERSIAATDLASSVGSYMKAPKEAYMKNITFLRDEPSTTIDWGVLFEDPATVQRNRSRKMRNKLILSGVAGVVTLSKIKTGDYLKSINGKKIGPSFDASRALTRMKDSLETDGYLSLVSANKEDGDDILIQATIIKPRPEMTYEELGMVVWHWGFLCIKSISKESIFKMTVLKSTDHIVTINDISCDKMTPESFARIVTELPYDITITVFRRKERWSGHFS